jgi:CheY-like chemotaxis protein
MFVPDRYVLVVDQGGESLQVMAGRLRRLGYRVMLAKTPEEARSLLASRRFRFGAALISPQIPAARLGPALEALRRASPETRLALLAAGNVPDRERRRELRAAGVSLALWDPVDSHTLRFQINRALSGEEGVGRRERSSLRAPADWPVCVRVAGREKEARVYSVSAGGAYLATLRPSIANAEVKLSLPLPSGGVTAAARVVMTNVPGNLQRWNLPIGMGVRFTTAGIDAEAALQLYVEERTRALLV